MRSEAFERESRRLDANLPQLPRIAVLGSTSFSHPNSAAVCKGLGVTLAALGAIALLTCGMSGVGDTVAKSFHDAQAANGLGGQVIHILPFGHQAPDFGYTHLPAARSRTEGRCWPG
jgi:predicted Rossmann-fold nucleotide-binding protein